MMSPAAKLSISVLGPFKAEINGKLLQGFRSAKVRALLAYLVVESHRSWPRPILADLLWPDQPEKEAQSNLRNAISNLRDVIGDRQRERHVLLISQNTIQYNQNSDSWLDSAAFMDQVSAARKNVDGLTEVEHLTSLEQALALYRGPFLEGLYTASIPYEEWALQKSEQYRKVILDVLRLLVNGYESAGDLIHAELHAKVWLTLEPWDEVAHRHLMRILYAQGQRNAALLQYEACRQIIQNELGIDPEPATTDLYQQIRVGQVSSIPAGTESFPAPRSQIPEFIKKIPKPEGERQLFVARKKELEHLKVVFMKVLQGQGRVFFVAGDPGSGKSTLLAEFSRQATQAEPELIVAWGGCNAYTGETDPYFPFIEILQTLCGDIEARVAGGALSRDDAIRLWKFVPQVIKIILDEGPQLIDRFISVRELLRIARIHQTVPPELVEELASFLKGSTRKSNWTPLQQATIFIQFAKVLNRLSQLKPLVLILDDLQWIDPNSANLLFHLGRKLSGSRILVLGAYRTEEVALGRIGERHPLEGVIHELQSSLGDIQIDLMECDGEDFIEALLDSEPNQLGDNFRQMLVQHTDGHPLFTIELLRGMQLRGDILRNPRGKWVESKNLNWDTLPARVEAVIAERIGHLPEKFRDFLGTASVEGEVFTAEILAGIHDEEPQQMIRDLSQEIGKRYRLVVAQRRAQVRGKPISQYRFRHFLYQKYLYQQKDEIEKSQLHEKIGLALEKLYKNDLDKYPEILHQLARHFDLAGLVEKAAHYYSEAGKYAVRLSANREAISHFERALQLIQLPETEALNRQALELYLSLGPAFTATQGWAAPALEMNYQHAEELCYKMEDNAQLVPALWLLAVYRLGRSEHTLVDKLVERLYRLAQKLNDPGLLCLANLQVSPLYQGKLVEARQILERASQPRELDLQRSLAYQYGMSPTIVALAYLGNCLWLMGLVEQADQCSDEACQIAEELDIPMSTCYALGRLLVQKALDRDLENYQTQAEKLIHIARQHNLRNFELGGIFYLHWFNTQEGMPSVRDIEIMEEAMEAYHQLGTVLNRTTFLILLAQSCIRAGLDERGQAALNEAIETGRKTGERWFEAEALRLKAENLLIKCRSATPDEYREIENYMLAAHDLAREQGALTLELRATMDLCWIWQLMGRSGEGKQALEEVIHKFTEGLDRPEICSARKLLKTLSGE